MTSIMPMAVLAALATAAPSAPASPQGLPLTAAKIVADQKVCDAVYIKFLVRESADVEGLPGKVPTDQETETLTSMLNDWHFCAARLAAEANRFAAQHGIAPSPEGYSGESN